MLRAMALMPQSRLLTPHVVAEHSPTAALPAQRHPAIGFAPESLRLTRTANPKTQAAYAVGARAYPVDFSGAEVASQEPILDPGLAWDPGVREALDEFIRTYGKTSSTYSAERRPSSFFDLDGNVIGGKRDEGELGDSGDALFVYMLSQGLFKMPASWRDTSEGLTEEAVEALKAACPTGPDGEYLPTRDNKAGAEAILAIYNGHLPGSKTSAWRKAPDTMRYDYAWSMQLMAGYKPEELDEIMERALDVALSEDHSTLPVGNQEVNVRIRPHLQMNDLMQRQQDHGFNVVITSATYAPMVRAVAKRMGIPADHIIGSEPALDAEGRITTGFKACGPFPDNNQTVMNYGAGKRCGINEFNGVTDPMLQLHQPPDITFASGDSDGDRQFLEYAKAKLVVKRKGIILDYAAAQFGGGWLLNRPFVGR